MPFLKKTAFTNNSYYYKKKGKEPGQLTPYQEGRERNFRTLKAKKLIQRKPVFLSKGDYHKSKWKGGDYYARKKDRPSPGKLLGIQ